MNRAIIRSIGSALIILSGILLISDKFVSPEFTLENTYGFKSAKTFLWTLSQTLSPIVILMGVQLKPFNFSYAVPVYLYFIQLYWVFDPSLRFDDSLLHLYAAGVTVATVFLIRVVHIQLFKASQTQNKRIQLLESLLDLYFKADDQDRKN